jgi:ubiquinone/menaquinone biosynthesis C-methylase UbiE
VAEPGGLEILLTLLGRRLFRRVYRDQVARLPLVGNERVLDFGSGTGEAADHLSQRLPRGRVTAVDVSEKWMRVLRRRLEGRKNVEPRLGDIRTLDIPDASQDVLFVHFVIHHVDPAYRPEIVQAAVRKLAPGGRAFVFEPAREIGQDEIDRLMASGGLHRVSISTGSMPLLGPTIEAEYVRPA